MTLKVNKKQQSLDKIVSFSDEQMVNFYVFLMQIWCFRCDLIWKILIWWMIMWVLNLSLAKAMWPRLRGRVIIRQNARRTLVMNALTNLVEALEFSLQI